ncbi:MAG: sn-glycerol-3-phosphate ABC transporter ATP-binding protein UgpC [Chloroflexi bacterium]|nr:sn-glycerol-3-phosphate ABC transporter ATP-binding protein UgpC [Chloroflexota bacterium]MQC27068.1 sn-glycerol-3-phosphate ABC transporter ATP-binding protein UgpC [Chloroflexota bacterium]
MASVTYDHVYKRFGDVTAVNDLNIHVEDKEFLVLVGPSGCGKSTALRLLAGLEEISDGQILIGDRVVNDLPPKDRDIAMVFQSYALYPHMSVFDNMAFGLRLRKMDKAEIRRRVEYAADILGIGPLLDRKPRQLSGGQRQRVAVGRAIVREPNVFLLDEPLSNLDAKLRVQTRAEISKLHKELATTFIYVTHDQVEAMTMATRIAVINYGLLQQIETPKNLYDRPANKFVAGFIGSPAMNFFDAKISKANGKLVADTGNFTVDVPKGRTKAYDKYVGKAVTLGIRPEDIHNAKFTPANITPSKVAAEVDVVELMGNEIVAYAKSGSDNFVARVDPRSAYKYGDKVQMVFNVENMHVFDKDTEEAVR